MKRTYSLPCFLLLLCYFGVSACNDDDQTQDFASQRMNQLAVVFNEGVLPTHSNLVSSVALLSSISQLFAEAPTVEALNALREQWRRTINNWKQAELYDFGDISESFLHFRIHRWPVSPEAVEDAILAATIIDENYVDGLGSSAIGLAAIEYLLFVQDEATTINTFIQNPQRLDYLRALTAHLNSTVDNLNERWMAYGPAFIDATELSVFGGQNELVNGLVAYLEESIRFRLGEPLGEANGGVPNADLTETPYASVSLKTLQAGFDEWQTIFTGNFASNTGYGFDDYLILLGNEELGPRIIAAIEAVNAELAALLIIYPSGNLQMALENDQQLVTELQGSMQQLLVLINVDMASFTGATITVNDTDGD